MRIALVLSTILLACAASSLPACAEDEAKTDDQAGSEGKTVRTESGLEITELKPGEGDHPTRDSVVEVHYHGTFEDGEVFDSSVDRGKPATFPLSRVIPCWTEGVAMMGVGGKSRLVCPPAIAYGARGMPPRIPPNSTLTFEVELLRIVK
jgi:FKBP-type peptidyl-prolyl cis-trans isomerase FkpA/FKBP-type peptidyl-prolyl cis-trans isomerase FklB